jgi:hypothetical protein
MNNENDDQTNDDAATTEGPRGSGLGELPCSACRYVYVVATGGFRFAVESEIPISLESAFKSALPRFESLGCNLGAIVEITECSDNADPSDPHYIETISVLKMLGKFFEPNSKAQEGASLS